MGLLLPWTEKKTKVRVAIIGDIILDEYLDGTVSRISPEAPVPVHLVKKMTHTAGGAANAARNISLAGGSADLFGVCGTDNAGEILLNLLHKDHVNTDSVIPISQRPTNRKTRVTSSNHQMMRIDWELVQALEKENQDILLKKLSDKEFDAILISDYGKGLLPKELLSKIFEEAHRKKIPCVVDPKGEDFFRYKGCTIMTPNLRECYIALNLDEHLDFKGEELGRKLQEKFGLNDILVTMGARGMVYVPQDKTRPCIHKKAEAKEVYDVSGAGDTVAAILTLGLGSGAVPENVIGVANTAAAIVVGKWGTQPVTEKELLVALNEDKLQKAESSKILNEKQLKNFKTTFSKKGSKVVFTNGCFDILHAGHVDYLEKAKALGNLLVVGVNTDESIRNLKGPERPIISLEHRLKLLSALSCIDYLIPFKEATPLKLIETLSPDILVKGADYDESNIVGASYVKNMGGSVHRIDLVPNISTSIIVNKILKKDQ